MEVAIKAGEQMDQYRRSMDDLVNEATHEALKHDALTGRTENIWQVCAVQTEEALRTLESLLGAGGFPITHEQLRDLRRNVNLRYLHLQKQEARVRAQRARSAATPAAPPDPVFGRASASPSVSSSSPPPTQPPPPPLAFPAGERPGGRPRGGSLRSAAPPGGETLSRSLT